MSFRPCLRSCLALWLGRLRQSSAAARYLYVDLDRTHRERARALQLHHPLDPPARRKGSRGALQILETDSVTTQRQSRMPAGHRVRSHQDVAAVFTPDRIAALFQPQRARGLRINGDRDFVHSQRRGFSRARCRDESPSVKTGTAPRRRDRLRWGSGLSSKFLAYCCNLSGNGVSGGGPAEWFESSFLVFDVIEDGLFEVGKVLGGFATNPIIVMRAKNRSN